MEDNKKCTTIWLRPSVIRRMDAWLEEANCRSRSEFIEKAVRFYMGYLGTEDTSEYLSDALVATLRGIIADSTNRTNSIQALPIPSLLSLLAFNSPSAEVKGLRWRIAAPCVGMWWTR